MKTDDILSKYSLTRDIAARYIDAIVRNNQTETADELDVSRDTVNRYKNSFKEMGPRERALLISTLLQEKLLERSAENGQRPPST